MTHVYCTILVLQLFSWLAAATGSGIVDGKVAEPHSKRYMASLHSQGGHTCGGMLIREDFVLTAAHCPQGKVTVILGAHNISEEETSQQRIKVAKFYPHPEYKNYSNDIMLLKLQHRAKLNRYVHVIGLPTDGEIPASKRCTVAGWGQTVPGKKGSGLTSDVLKETTEKIEAISECKHYWQKYFYSDHMICTRPVKTGGVCWGDSGGPIICDCELQGITAFVHPDDCSRRDYPHVFTKIHPFIPWIKKVMQRKVAA